MEKVLLTPEENVSATTFVRQGTLSTHTAAQQQRLSDAPVNTASAIVDLVQNAPKISVGGVGDRHVELEWNIILALTPNGSWSV